MSVCDRSDGFKELQELLVIGSQIKSVICCQESSNIWIKNIYFLSWRINLLLQTRLSASWLAVDLTPVFRILKRQLKPTKVHDLRGLWVFLLIRSLQEERRQLHGRSLQSCCVKDGQESRE